MIHDPMPMRPLENVLIDQIAEANARTLQLERALMTVVDILAVVGIASVVVLLARGRRF